MKTIAVLVTSAGVSSAINVIKSLLHQKAIPISIVATDMDALAPGLYLADKSYRTPPVKDSERYVDTLLKICRHHQVKALYPCYSGELTTIARASRRFVASGVQLMISPPSVIEHCDDKYRANATVGSMGIPVPRIINNPAPKDLPLFTKYARGSGSSGSSVVDSAHLLRHYLTLGDNRLFQEYLQGTEFTVDILCDRSSDLLFCGPRRRISVKSGQCVKGETSNIDVLFDYSKAICKRLGVVGVCNIQFIESQGTYYFIEINPRFSAGGLMLTLHAGANLPFLLLKLMLGLPIKTAELRHRPGVIMTRYWHEIILRKRSFPRQTTRFSERNAKRI